MKSNTKKAFLKRITLTAGSLPAVIGNAFAAEEKATVGGAVFKTLGDMFKELVNPLESYVQDGLVWAYNWEAVLIPVSTLLALGFVYIKYVWNPGEGGQGKSFSQQAGGEHKMGQILRNLGMFVVACIVVYAVCSKFLPTVSV